VFVAPENQTLLIDDATLELPPTWTVSTATDHATEKSTVRVQMSKTIQGILGVVAIRLLDPGVERVQFMYPGVHMPLDQYKALHQRANIPTSVEMNKSTVWVGDPTATACILNHSDAANCKLVNIENIMYIRVISLIEVGEELTLNYGKSFWDDLKDPQNTFCCVCMQRFSVRGNKMILCDVCDVGQHQLCFERERDTKGSWLCDTHAPSSM
jgi:hypothetical protein